MAENIQKEYESRNAVELIKLLVSFAVRRINLQHILYFTAFLAFGVGDGITGAYMMEKLGTSIEANPVARYLFINQGFGGMVMAKMWITGVILFAAYIVAIKSQESMYWTVNGFLIALTAGGIMAINANLTAIAGEIPHAPSEMIFAYLALVLALTEVGSFVDRRTYYTRFSIIEEA